ncbi:hypothetical protein BJ085DRAFT_31009 [Dimargaris cristalligena]|uniref:Uncharacterized protein n=1 Tax=Dimargaris cristalligena TaxID=215637 RepID=A0A4P9ZT55_9FUNG|nr:hypothetical protein BJ085DRAFT_31009 [Dimargaris cristalligena]|eukprot:RKP36754.1 hypothetical protein BJ085DRAFT_31009 [Dimargaris cristalligena]
MEYPESNLPKQCYMLYNSDTKGLRAKGRVIGLKANQLMAAATGGASEEFDPQTLSELKDSFEQANEGDRHTLLTKNPLPSDGSRSSTYALLPTETGAFAIKITFFNFYSAGTKAEKVCYLSLDSAKGDITEHIRIMETCFGPALQVGDVAISPMKAAPSDMGAGNMNKMYQ